MNLKCPEKFEEGDIHGKPSVTLCSTHDCYKTNDTQTSTLAYMLTSKPTFCEMCTTQSCVQFHRIQGWDT